MERPASIDDRRETRSCHAGLRTGCDFSMRPLTIDSEHSEGDGTLQCHAHAYLDHADATFPLT